MQNLAPYSQFQNLTFDPPYVMFSANQTTPGTRKDTVNNVEQTGEFAYNMATNDLPEIAVGIPALKFAHYCHLLFPTVAVYKIEIILSKAKSSDSDACFHDGRFHISYFCQWSDENRTGRF